MLVLTRKRDEEIEIEVGGVLVYIRIVDIDRNRVRVGISAPNHVRIMRKELTVPPEDGEHG